MKIHILLHTSLKVIIQNIGNLTWYLWMLHKRQPAHTLKSSSSHMIATSHSLPGSKVIRPCLSSKPHTPFFLLFNTTTCNDESILSLNQSSQSLKIISLFNKIQTRWFYSQFHMTWKFEAYKRSVRQNMVAHVNLTTHHHLPSLFPNISNLSMKVSNLSLKAPITLSFTAWLQSLFSCW